MEYLSKNRDMISTLSRRGCVLCFVNNRLARGFDNHIQCVIFVRCYQHIVDNVVMVYGLRDTAKLSKMLGGKRKSVH